MQNSWKGLAVGGLTGALVGILIDIFAKAMAQAALGAERARGHGPDAAEWLQSVTHRASEWVHDADVPERAREVAQRLVESDLASRAGATAARVAETTLDKARSSIGHSS